MSDSEDRSDELLRTGGLFKGKLMEEWEREMAAERPSARGAVRQLEVGERLDNYQIVRLIGSGGMGSVYEAVDLDLRRHVALKLLEPDVVASAGVRARLRHEAKAVASLNHPNICVLYQASSEGDTPYLVLELIDGDTLDKVASERSLSTDEALEVSSAVADALAAAHRRGLLHRDVKPANIAITRQGHVKLLDFGIAKPLSVSGGPSADPAGETAVELSLGDSLVGTVSYMSPEQVRGEPLDERSDVFSLGVVLYELLVGRKAFPGSTTGARIDAVLRREPESLLDFGHDPRVHKLVNRAMAKERDDRFESAEALRDALVDLREQLRQKEAASGGLLRKAAPIGAALLLAAAVIAAAIGVSRYWLARGSEVSSLNAPQSVAVLRFETLTEESADEFLEVAVSDVILGVLARSESLSVRPFAESHRIELSRETLGEAREKLGADLLIGGQIWQRSGVLQVSIEAVDAERGEVRWRESIRSQSVDLLELRQRVSAAISDGLLPALGIEGASGGTDPVRADAYRLYLRARSSLSDPAPVRTAIELLRQATAADPGFAPAWAELGRRLHTAAFYYEDGGDSREEARRAYERALELDGDRIEAQLGLVSLYLEFGEIGRAASVAAELAASRPAVAAAHVPMALVLRYQGMIEESVGVCDRAYALDGRAPEVRQCAMSYLWNGSYAEVEREVGRISSLLWQNEVLARIALMKGERQRAADLWGRQLHEEAGILRRDHVVLCLEEGREAARQPIEREYGQLVGFHDAEWQFYSAGYFAICGFESEAIALLTGAFQGGYCVDPSRQVDPLLASLEGTVALELLRDRADECRRGGAS